MLFKKTSFYIALVLSSYALISIIPVSYNTFLNKNPCPIFFNILPACYIVTIGYLLVVIGLLIKSTKMFFVGWSPIFLLAISGSTMEVLGNNVCPQNSVGTPLCFYSLLVSSLILFFFLTNKYLTQKQK